MKKLLSLLLALLILGIGSTTLAQGAPAVSAGGACLMEASTGRVLYEKNADVQLPMASTTKIMTALLAVERCSLDEMVKIDDSAVGTEGSSMYLDHGETLSMVDLLHGLMLTSGNDAAVAIAIHISGSTEDFAKLMNSRAKELGCTNTNFVTPNGLHRSDHYSTARDMSLIACYAMQNKDFSDIVSTEYHQTTTGERSRTLKNKNRILWEYEGGNGVKTGYTQRSGKCLVFSAEREGMQLVGTVINCPDMWNTAKGLLDYGFENYEMTSLVDAQSMTFSVPVENSEKKHLAVAPEHSILYPTKKNGEDTINVTHSLPELTEAPLMCGTELGSITVRVNDTYVATQNLIAIESAEKLSFWYFLGKVFSRWLS